MHRSDRWVDARDIKRFPADNGHLLNEDVNLAFGVLECAFDEPREVIVDVSSDLNGESEHHCVHLFDSAAN